MSKEPVKVSRKRVNDVFIKLSNWSAEVGFIEGVRAAIIKAEAKSLFMRGQNKYRLE